ncbi:hypothetical protein GR200_24340 [Rhizobium leguminosarum]|nr:hypothetical protein [Rhizobium leguminosarum]NEI87039.1 hypothetical protein [Rhizobium leguminosarum]TBF83844.1 hypothetical protein ELG86_17625 [Rhizobium leguminosarum]TBG69420.1 hypothetical protein ELG74_16830 [Rhizobium leguminosarum]TBH03289.1 hypothetical protein ELG70_17395 [Rhizobium leguminosarum]
MACARISTCRAYRSASISARLTIRSKARRDERRVRGLLVGTPPSALPGISPTRGEIGWALRLPKTTTLSH